MTEEREKTEGIGNDDVKPVGRNIAGVLEKSSNDGTKCGNAGEKKALTCRLI